ncbi:hypothetical protein ACFFIR_17680, partial [Microbacterium arthrosphaerae]
AAGSSPGTRPLGEDGSPSASDPPRANGADRPSTPDSPDEGGTAGDGSTGRRTRIALSAGSPAAAGSTGSAEVGQTPSPQAEPAAGDAEGEAAGRPTSGRPWWRRTRTLWIASVLLAAIVASAVTVLVSQFPTGRVAVLRVDPDAEWPEDFFGPSQEGVTYEEFLGLSTLVAPQDWNQGQELDCLYVRAAENDSGPSTGGCSSGFPPTAGLVVVLSSPEELRERFPVGTALQFVAEGSEVHVYAKPPPLTERTP